MSKFVAQTVAKQLEAIGINKDGEGRLHDRFPAGSKRHSVELLAALDPSAFDPIPKPRSADWLACHKEYGQTYDKFRYSNYNKITPDSTIYIQPLGENFLHGSYRPLLDALAQYTEAFFTPLRVECLNPINLAGNEFGERVHYGRKQFLSTDIITWLQERRPANGYCLIGITMEDLYPDPSWNFVFGQASLVGRAGIYSFQRYIDSNTFESAEKTRSFLDPSKFELNPTFLARCMKVMTHELCHMFNMQHCIYFSCLECGSNHLEESDARPMHLCPVCLRKLMLVLAFSPLERYVKLRSTLGSILDKFGWRDSKPFSVELSWLDSTISSIQNNLLGTEMK